jgi:integrase
MQALTCLRHKLSTSILKPATVRKYELKLNQYIRFMGPNPIVELWSDESCALWVFHYMEVMGHVKNTLKGMIPVFTYGVFKYTGRKCETARDQRYSVLGMVAKAIEQRADNVKRKLAIGSAGLSKCFAIVFEKCHVATAIQLWAWWIVSYGAMLRCSEAGRIQWKEVNFSQDRLANGVPKQMVITIRALEDETFKTHQCSVEFRFVARTTAGVCPVNAMWGWYEMCMRERGQAVGAVFCLAIDVVRRKFQEVAATALGGTTKDYGLHSLRAGAATDAEELGWSISEIMFMGRWRSPTVLVYLRQGDKWLHELGLPAKRGLTVRPTLFRG